MTSPVATAPNGATAGARSSAGSSLDSQEHELTFREQVRLFSRFFRYLRPYRDKVALGILLMFVGVPLGQVGNFLNRYLWDDVLLAFGRPTDQRLSLFFGIVA